MYGQALKIRGELFVDTPLTDPVDSSSFVDRLRKQMRRVDKVKTSYNGPFEVVKRFTLTI